MRASILRSFLFTSLLAAGCADTTGFRLVDAGASADLVVATDQGSPAVDVPTATDLGHDAGVDVPAVVDVPLAVDAGFAVDAPDASAADVSSDSGQVVDAPVNDVGEKTCIGRPASCASGTPGGACGDSLTGPDCVDGSWRCAEGTIPVTECACVGRLPRGCTCESTGVVCPDGGAL